jgi:hypothetical protein
MSTGGAATKAMMYTDTAVNSVGIMITPNQPTYRRFSVEVQPKAKSRRSRIAVICFYKVFKKKFFPN